MSIYRDAAKETVKTMLSVLNRPKNVWRFHQAIRTPGPHKVNVGCGPAPMDGWLNTDISWMAPMYLDMLKPWPVPAGAVGWIYADNVIEHLSLTDGRVALHHIFEALRPGGSVRIVTPDVGRVADAFVNDPAMTMAHVERHARHGYTVAYPVDSLRVIFCESGHHVGYCYDLPALTSEMEHAGFTDIARFEVGDSNDPVFKGLELDDRIESPSDHFTLALEGHKPIR